MEDESEPRAHPPVTGTSIGSARIFGLTEEERAMLREFAAQLRGRPVRNQVARAALDRAADELDQAAESPRN
jgi:hypothetical protein